MSIVSLSSRAAISHEEHAMHEYLFDVKLFAAIRVKAESEKQARAMIIAAIDANTANLGAWPNGDPITCEVSLDNPDEDILIEVDGEPAL